MKKIDWSLNEEDGRLGEPHALTVRPSRGSRWSDGPGGLRGNG
jgi:hypothetical protein